MSTTDEVNFIYIGSKLPNYAKSSIFLANKFSGMHVNFIGNKILWNELKSFKLSFLPIEDFYLSDKFELASENLSSAKNFRNGFWLRTLERFFVIEQYMSTQRKDRLFHAELDQILFRTDNLVNNLESQYFRGIYLPFHTKQKSIASVFYCNEIDAVRSFLDFSISSGHFRNEMELLAKWATCNPDKVKALPTYSNLIDSDNVPKNILTFSHNDLGGIVDAAQLGQWIAGVDVQNVPLFKLARVNHVDTFEDGLVGADKLSEIKFNFDCESNTLSLNNDKFDAINIYNLHIHSKIHQWIKNGNLNKLLNMANAGNKAAIPYLNLKKLNQIFNKRNLKAVLSFNKLTSFLMFYTYHLFKVRPSSRPFISGDGFRKISDHIFEKPDKHIDLNKIKFGDIIFCDSDLVHEFKNKILDNLTVKVILIFGNSDFNFSAKSKLDDLHERTVSVFAQNLVDKIKGFQALPIGLENRWRANHGKIYPFKIRRFFKLKKIYKVIYSFSLESNYPVRSKAFRALQKSVNTISLGNLSPNKHRKALAKYAFIAAPPGNGLDTHRCWEAMYLRCVPIVLKSEMTETFILKGLPIWIVESYEEVIEFSEEMLELKYKELESKFKSQALWLDYWTQEIVSSKNI